MSAVPPGRGGAAHQLVIVPAPARTVEVTCTCLRAAAREPIGVQARWAGGEAYRAWEAHLQAEADTGIEAGI